MHVSEYRLARKQAFVAIMLWSGLCSAITNSLCRRRNHILETSKQISSLVSSGFALCLAWLSLQQRFYKIRSFNGLLRCIFGIECVKIKNTFWLFVL